LQYLTYSFTFYLTQPQRAIQGSFANCNISVDLDLFNEGIIEYTAVMGL